MKIANLAMDMLPIKNIAHSENHNNTKSFANVFKEELTEVNFVAQNFFANLDEEERDLIIALQNILKDEDLNEEDVALVQGLIQFINQLTDLRQAKENSWSEIQGNSLKDGGFKAVHTLLEEISLKSFNQQELPESLLPIIEKLKGMLQSSDRQNLDVQAKELSNDRPIFTVNRDISGMSQEKDKETVQKILANNLLFYRKSSKLPSQETLVVPKEEVEEISLKQAELSPLPKFNDFKVDLTPLTEETNINNILKTINTELKDKIVVLKNGEVTTSKMELYPEELGEVIVLLELNKGQLNVRIIAGNEQAFNHLSEQGKELQQRFESDSFSEVNIEFLMDSKSGEKEKQPNQSQGKGFNLSNEDMEEEEYMDLVQSAYNYKV